MPVNAKDIQDRLRRSIQNEEYSSIEELSANSGIGISTIQKFLNGGDILFSDAAQLIATTQGSIVLPNDWLDMKMNIMEKIEADEESAENG
ncbi:MAG TPA: hypothetical protein H9962_07835 [Candidatus Mailhella merdigallinarum]|uniref:Uncharacterized protein n=1 Tax=Candidatus Mailhella merdigallinarum TaxID=2838658 RepID=A0A9D2HD73_9BACT|nr:hypothetical protein [Candidatus Mailhella merdigallinarum]